MKKYCIFALMASFLLLGGCFRSAPTSYYLLESASEPIRTDSMPDLTLRIAQVESPTYLNRNNIVSRVTNETRVILAEFHLWAEPVSNGVRRIMEEVLTRPLLEKGINVLPVATEERGDYVLVIDVQRLDGNFNAQAVFSARWSLLNSRDKTVASGIFSDETQVEGADYNILVKAESQLVRKFGEYLASRLPAIMRSR